MRVLPVTLFATVMLAASPGLAATAAKKPPPKAAAKVVAPEPPPPPPPPDPDARMRTSDEVKRESVGGAVTAPLRDLNVLRTKIPPVLLAAMTDPYARPPRAWRCPQLASLVTPLNEALGPDLDIVPAADEDISERTKETALGAAADFASDAIPFRGWVRRLTGAERHDKLVQSAIIAGNIRRGYLKGLGESRGCMPPATPSHERAGSAPAKVGSSPLKPKYPTTTPAAPKTSAETPRSGDRR